MSPSFLGMCVCGPYRTFIGSLISLVFIEFPSVPDTVPGARYITVIKTDSDTATPTSLRVHLLTSRLQPLHPWARGYSLRPEHRAGGKCQGMKTAESSSQTKPGCSWWMNSPAPLPLGQIMLRVCFIPSQCFSGEFPPVPT